MKNAMKFLIGSFAICAMTAGVAAQNTPPPQTKNAALRYWLALSELRDEQTDKATRELLENTAGGWAKWNEKSLGKILDSNLHAIQIMQRASKLPECDWGLEPRSDEPVAGLVTKARILARLNTLEGIRLAAKGDSSGAVDSWLAGVKFSQNLSKGGALIFILVARAALLSDLNAMKRAGEAGSLDAKSRTAASAALASLPATGFDWGDSWETEASFIENGWQEILKSNNPKAKYKELMGEDADANVQMPTAADIVAYRKFMDEVAASLRLPPSEAHRQLSALLEKEKALNPLLRSVIPNFEKVNTNREEVQTARELALKALTSK